MFRSAYSRAYQYGVLPLRETASDTDYEPQQRFLQWSDEQLQRIRVVLQRLTALRIQNADDVEDLVQETMLTMMTKCPQCDLKKGLLVWSMGILRKKIGNYYRRSHRAASLIEQSVQFDSIDQALTPQSPEAIVRYTELRALIDQILEGLPQHEQQAMNMLLAGMAPSRIVERLRPVRYQNVINRLYRGRQKIQRELSKLGYSPNR